MNELQEFFQSVAIEKKKVAEEQARIQAREERLQPQVKVELTDLSEFFGTMATAKRNLKPKTIQDVVTPAKPEQTKMHLELESLDDLYEEEEEIEPYETVYENGKWKSSRYRISFKD